LKRVFFFLGTFSVAILLFLAILGPMLSPHSPFEMRLDRELMKPSAQHLLGCDSNGTDILSILIHGSRLTLSIGFLVTLVSVSIGLLLGTWAGYYGGWRDSLVMRILDTVFAFPGTILAIAMASMLGPSTFNVVLCLSATGWAGYTRLVRGEVLALRQQEFVESARALGLKEWRIFFFHIWPNLLGPLLVAATFGVGGAILAESSLSFLGIGSPPGTPSWGGLLNSGRDHLLEAPHIATFPGLCIAWAILTFHGLGEYLRRRFDPRKLRTI
jgi:peptide/nickel transport system permease protein